MPDAATGLCQCGLRTRHPGVCKVKRRRNTVGRRIKQLQAASQRAAHGTHARYVGGKCRCEECREANRAYEEERQKRLAQGITNKVISAAKARRHILKLSENGIGYKTLADAAGVGKTIVQEVRLGQRKRIREETERRILSVDETALPESAKIDAAPTWQLINDLVAQGYAKSQIAKWLGSKSPGLQIGKRGVVCASTALAVEKLYRRLQARPETKSADAYGLTDAAATWKLIDELVEDGYTLKQLAEWLGCDTFPLARKNRRIRKQSAARIADLYRRLREGLLRRAS
jgi:hypothetical protein